jgi:hypothetical protein
MQMRVSSVSKWCWRVFIDGSLLSRARHCSCDTFACRAWRAAVRRTYE